MSARRKIIGQPVDVVSSDKEEVKKMTLYIPKSTAKEFMKRAIDEDRDFSELATIAIQKYLAVAKPIRV